MESNETSALKPGGRYTLDDYRSWPEDERWELIYGVAYSMSPAPRLKHQRLLIKFIAQLSNQLEGNLYAPPAGTRLDRAVELSVLPGIWLDGGTL